MQNAVLKSSGCSSAQRRRKKKTVKLLVHVDDKKKSKKVIGLRGIRTLDLRFTRPTPYHLAIRPYAFKGSQRQYTTTGIELIFSAKNVQKVKGQGIVSNVGG